MGVYRYPMFYSLKRYYFDRVYFHQLQAGVITYIIQQCLISSIVKLEALDLLNVTHIETWYIRWIEESISRE